MHSRGGYTLINIIYLKQDFDIIICLKRKKTIYRRMRFSDFKSMKSRKLPLLNTLSIIYVWFG